MNKVKVSAFSVSMDGFGAGPNQDINNPMGVGGMKLHEWILKTKMFHEMTGIGGGHTGVDNDLAKKAAENIGAWILGRNMFGPVRGPWTDDSWKGWWGENPPYHTPVFILTHHPRAPIQMEGGTTFYFVTDGIESALKKAREAAMNQDVRIGGGASTVKQYLKAGLIDEMHLAFSPVFLGTGENLFLGINLPELGFECTDRITTEQATHLFLTRKKI